MRICARHGLPAIPFGAGSSLEGHLNALLGGISFDMLDMNRIIAVHAEDADCVVEPSVTRSQLNDHLRDHGLSFPIDPGADAHLGGMSATRASGRNAEGDAWGRLIRVRDRDGVCHEWSMPMAELAGGGDAYRARLLAMGLELAPGTKARNALHRLLTTANPQARARCVSTLGWHGAAYMLPVEVSGKTAGERYVLQSSAPLVHAFRCGGTLEEWREAIGKTAIGNSRLVLSISMAFAAPLLRPLGMRG